MILVTSGDVAGYRITESLGLVRGSSVRTRHLGSDITLVGILHAHLFMSALRI